MLLKILYLAPESELLKNVNANNIFNAIKLLLVNCFLLLSKINDDDDDDDHDDITH